MAKWKTKNGVQTGFVPGVGEIVNGEIEASENWNAPNFEKVTSQIQAAPAAPVPPAPLVNPTPPQNPQVKETV